MHDPLAAEFPDLGVLNPLASRRRRATCMDGAALVRRPDHHRRIGLCAARHRRVHVRPQPVRMAGPDAQAALDRWPRKAGAHLEDGQPFRALTRPPGVRGDSERSGGPFAALNVPVHLRRVLYLGATRAGQRVIPEACVQHVMPEACVQHVMPEACVQHVMPEACVQHVMPEACVQHDVASPAKTGCGLGAARSVAHIIRRMMCRMLRIAPNSRARNRNRPRSPWRAAWRARPTR